ncbi:MAG: IS256 family transposase [Rubricoccaceae bacterium]|nr:IS256 family transposase [Rubricoccaceae bacterium]
MALRKTKSSRTRKGADMSSVVRTVGKRKKSRVLRETEIVSRDAYRELELDSKVEMIRALVPLGLMHVEEVLDEEVRALAGERYERKGEEVRGRRHGTNPGTVRLAGQRVRMRIPRVRGRAGAEIPLRSYELLSGDGEVDDLLLRRVLYGISCGNYESAAEAIPGAIGLSGSTVSRRFVEASASKLRAMQERDLSGDDVVAIFVDGKTFADATMVVALGVTMSGEKRFLGFVETDTENEPVLTTFLRSLMERGLNISHGILAIIDGGKGLRAAVRKAFRNRALVQRCQWHKRENVVSYLSKSEQPVWRRRLQRAYERPDYDEARTALDELHRELEERNQSAAASLREGFDETLTLHRLGVYGILGRSLKTTNCLESVNSLVEDRCARVDHWKNSSQRQRWMATSLLEIEPRLRKVMGYRHLPKLRDAIKRQLNPRTKIGVI